MATQIFSKRIQSDNFHLNNENIQFGTVTASVVTVSGSAIITGSLTVSGSSTMTNYGTFNNYMINTPNANWGDHKFVIQSKTLNDAFSSISAVQQIPYVQFIASSSGHIGVGTQEPQHTLHVSQSSADWNALHVEGPTQTAGVGGTTFANATTISDDTVIFAGYNAMLFTSNYNQSITISAGTEYTIQANADVRLVNMSNVGNIPQTFYNAW
jgi:hypothetical protein